MALFTGSPITLVDRGLVPPALQGDQFEGHLRIADSGTYTHDAAAGVGDGVIELMRLPAGRIQIHTQLSRIATSQFVATSNFSLGYQAHTREDGTAVAADPDAFAVALDVGGAALEQVWPIIASTTIRTFDTREGLVIECLIDTANIEVGDLIRVTCVYSRT